MCQESQEGARPRKEKDSISSILIGASTAERSMSSEADLNFRMFKAENGHVMEVRQYDRRTDRNSNKLYLITDDQDLGAEISKIITLESLRN